MMDASRLLIAHRHRSRGPRSQSSSPHHPIIPSFPLAPHTSNYPPERTPYTYPPGRHTPPPTPHYSVRSPFFLFFLHFLGDN